MNCFKLSYFLVLILCCNGCIRNGYFKEWLGVVSESPRNIVSSMKSKKHPYSFRVHEKEILNQVDKNSEKYSGYLYAFFGEVISAVEKENLIYFQILVKDDVDDFGGTPISVIFRRGDTTISKGHFVKVLGYIGGEVDGVNLFGSQIKNILLEAISVVDLYSKIVYMAPFSEKDKQFCSEWESGELFSFPNKKIKKAAIYVAHPRKNV